jgi:hypothetical protein
LKIFLTHLKQKIARRLSAGGSARKKKLIKKKVQSIVGVDLLAVAQVIFGLFALVCVGFVG